MPTSLPSCDFNTEDTPLDNFLPDLCVNEVGVVSGQDRLKSAFLSQAENEVVTEDDSVRAKYVLPFSFCCLGKLDLELEDRDTLFRRLSMELEWGMRGRSVPVVVAVFMESKLSDLV